MSWLWIVVVAILVGCMMNGRRRGLVRTVFMLFSSVLALALTAAVTPTVSKQIQENEELYAYVEEKIDASLAEYVKEGKNASEQNEVIEALPLPKALREKLLENKNSEVYSAMAVDGLQEYVVKYVTGVVINAGAFVAVFLIVNVLLTILARVLNIISRLPVLNSLNRTAGALAGLLQGLVIVWVLCIVLTMFSSTEFAKDIYNQIDASELLSFLYNNNLLLDTVAGVMKVLK